MTVDKSRLAQPERPTLPDFAPVPRKYRHDGWTPERQAGFIEALSDTGSVKAAAHAVNMTPEGAYYLRRQPGADEFRAPWEAALGHGVRRLADIGLERALYGVEVPVYHFGAVVGTRRLGGAVARSEALNPLYDLLVPAWANGLTPPVDEAARFLSLFVTVAPAAYRKAYWALGRPFFTWVGLA